MDEKQKLIELVESLRRTKHYECEDGFYSCPALSEYYGLDGSGECKCGLVENNAKVDEALRLIESIQPAHYIGK